MQRQFASRPQEDFIPGFVSENTDPATHDLAKIPVLT